MLVVVQTVQQVRHIVRHGWHFVGFVRLCLIAPFIRGFVVPVQNGVDSAVVIQKIVRVSASAQSVAQFVGGGKLAHFGLIEQIPEADIQATVTLFGKGGGSGETGSVSIGQGLKRDASGAIAVRIGEGLDFDSANALTVRKETVMTSEDLLNEEETQQEIVDMLK